MHGGAVVQLAVRTTHCDGELASFAQSLLRNLLLAIPRSRYLTLAVGEHSRVSLRRGWRSTGQGHLHRLLDRYYVRKHKTTRATLPRLADRRRHSALASDLRLPKVSMAQSDASDEIWIAWTIPSSTDEFSGRPRSLITVRNGACASCRQGGDARSPLPTYMSPRRA
jgi:hypothetical protein